MNNDKLAVLFFATALTFATLTVATLSLDSLMAWMDMQSPQTQVAIRMLLPAATIVSICLGAVARKFSGGNHGKASRSRTTR
ncbi:hypothetical protein [Pseudoduganella violaceinigra]|uniref:hypothetical protein n=1 Tax=Pseudoduganella violaceinigra TaxID=246602 RepID=UPI00041CF09A|nr:hypothetical protein [Pseudoduganella violaceinigra]